MTTYCIELIDITPYREAVLAMDEGQRRQFAYKNGYRNRDGGPGVGYLLEAVGITQRKRDRELGLPPKKHLNYKTAVRLAKALDLDPPIMVESRKTARSRVPNKPFRELVEARGLGGYAQVARLMGWFDANGTPDVNRLKRTLGVNARMNSKKREEKHYTTMINLQTADLLCMALDTTLEELGL